MKLESKTEYDFQQAVNQVMDWVSEHGNPHMKVEITNNSAEIFSGEYMHKTDAFLRALQDEPKNINGTIVEALYEKALLLACERIADSDQTYEEATTAPDWAERFLKQAQV